MLGDDRSLAIEHIGHRILPVPRFATPQEYNRYRATTGKPPQVRILIEDDSKTVQSKPQGIEVQIVDMNNPEPKPMSVTDYPEETQDDSLETPHP